jgi:hypothetical protein
MAGELRLPFFLLARAISSRAAFNAFQGNSSSKNKVVGASALIQY